MRLDAGAASPLRASPARRGPGLAVETCRRSIDDRRRLRPSCSGLQRDASTALYRDDARRECPVAHSAAHGGYWLLSRYDDVFQVARDDQTFSSAREVVVPPTNVGRLIPLQSDPPELERYRGLLIPFFSPAALKASGAVHHRGRRPVDRRLHRARRGRHRDRTRQSRAVEHHHAVPRPRPGRMARLRRSDPCGELFAPGHAGEPRRNRRRSRRSRRRSSPRSMPRDRGAARRHDLVPPRLGISWCRRRRREEVDRPRPHGHLRRHGHGDGGDQQHLRAARPPSGSARPAAAATAT